MKEFVRLGKPWDKARLIKLSLQSVEDKHKAHAGTKLLGTKRGDAYENDWGKIFITPDQTKKEREKIRKLREELDGRRKDNPDLVIFRDKIIYRGAKPEM